MAEQFLIIVVGSENSVTTQREGDEFIVRIRPNPRSIADSRFAALAVYDGNNPNQLQELIREIN